MINLLPAEDKIFIRREYLRRWLVLSGVFIFVFICSAVILFLPPYFFLSSQETNFKNQLSIVSKGLERADTEKIESSIRDLNAKLKSFGSQEEKLRQISALIQEILKAKSSNIRLIGFNFQKQSGEKKDTLTFQGIADNRNALLDFEKSLEVIKGIQKVNSPASNLLKQENIDFSLIIELTPLEVSSPKK